MTMKRVAVILSVIALTACGAGSPFSATAEAPANTNPRVGRVIIWGGNPNSYHTEKAVRRNHTRLQSDGDEWWWHRSHPQQSRVYVVLRHNPLKAPQPPGWRSFRFL